MSVKLIGCTLALGYRGLFGPVVLGTNRCNEGLPALLGEAECAWLKLRCWEDF